MSLLLIALLVFGMSAAIDLFWVLAVHYTTIKAPIRAGLWSAVLALIGALGTYAYIYDPRMLLPYTMGSFIGTYYAVHRLEKADANPDA